jgi:uncharacterized membrane protein YgdD (TMEM256/DUF423 family)
MLPVLPYPVLVPAVSAVALAAAGVLAGHDARPAHTTRHALTAAREHAAHAAVTLALALACSTQVPASWADCPDCQRPHNPNNPCKDPR